MQCLHQLETWELLTARDSVLRPISLPNILCLPQQALDCGGDVAKKLESKALGQEP